MALGWFPTPLNVLQVSTSLVSSPWTSSFRNLTPLAQAGQAGGVSMDLEDELKALNVEADGVVEAGQMLTGQQQQELVAAQGELAAAAAVFPQQQGNFDAAANAVQQLQQMAERLALEGVSSPMLLQDKGDLLAAMELLLREVLEEQREMLGPRHPDTLASINSLGMLLYDKGELAAAEPLLLEAKRWWSL